MLSLQHISPINRCKFLSKNNVDSVLLYEFIIYKMPSSGYYIFHEIYFSITSEGNHL